MLGFYLAHSFHNVTSNNCGKQGPPNENGLLWLTSALLSCFKNSRLTNQRDQAMQPKLNTQTENQDMEDDDVLDLGVILGDQPDDLTGRERRVSVRAYEYWASLLAGRNFPCVADLNANDIESFRDASILLDFSRDINKPVLRYVGKLLRDECGLSLSALKPEDVPGRSLLSRLTDHYLEILANRAPIGFEAEFNNLRGNLSMYRGLLMPLSDDGENINFIYGVISWKEVVSSMVGLPPLVNEATEDDDTLQLGTSLTPTINSDAEPFDLITADDEDEPQDEAFDLAPHAEMPDAAAAAHLANLLSAARDAAEAVQATEGRSRSALYDALDRAYQFSQAAMADPAAYTEVLCDAGLVVQDRAPFTPMVKLVFGATYDKTRLTEYAAALSYATREAIPLQDFRPFLDTSEGGLKAIVQAERAARAVAKGNQRVDKAETARERLRKAKPLGVISSPFANIDDDEFCLLVGRRRPGSNDIEIIAVAEEPVQLVDGILRRLPKR
jgi:hypothetical protein